MSTRTLAIAGIITLGLAALLATAAPAGAAVVSSAQPGLLTASSWSSSGVSLVKWPSSACDKWPAL